MKTFVIGGAGFIGNYVCHALVKAGHEVTIVGRRFRSLPHTAANCTYRAADLGNRAQIREILEPNCNVINLAYSTVPKTSYDNPTFDLLSNVPGSVNLLEELTSIGVRRLLQVSSGGTVYGPAQVLPIQESHPVAPISPYGITKLTIENYALMFSQTRDLPLVIVRPANAYSNNQLPQMGQGFLATLIDSVVTGKHIQIFGPSGTIRDYIHVSDVASGIVSALEYGKDGEIYNIGTGIGTSNLDVISMLRPLAYDHGLAINVNHLPPRRFDVDANILDSQKLKLVSGWTPKITLSEGIAEMWEIALYRSDA